MTQVYGREYFNKLQNNSVQVPEVNQSGGINYNAQLTLSQETMLREQRIQDHVINACLNQERAVQERAFYDRVFRENLAAQLQKQNESFTEQSSGEQFFYNSGDDPNDYYNLYDPETENFIKFLDAGCEIAEKVAIRHQHRPCFKKIHDLCFRTRGEINRPFLTVANIHSQGVPWATKDFIYAYVRLINCWHLMKGYLQVKDGSLGNINRELTSDFRACYSVWEHATRDLTEHMIRIFSNLDSNVSNPGPLPPFLHRSRAPKMSFLPEGFDSNLGTHPLDFDFDACVDEESQTPPTHDRIDMINETKKKFCNSRKLYSADRACPTVEFFPTTKNIEQHYKRLEAQRACSNDNEFEHAISACNNISLKNAAAEQAQAICGLDWRHWFDQDILNSPQECTPEAINDKLAQQQEKQTALAQQHVYQLVLQQQVHQQRAQRQAMMHPLFTPSPGQQRPTTNFENKYDKIACSVPMRRPMLKKIKTCSKHELECMKELLAEIGETEYFQSLTATPVGKFDCRADWFTMVRKSKTNLYTCSATVGNDLETITKNVLKYFKNDVMVTPEISAFLSIIAKFRRSHHYDACLDDTGEILCDSEPEY